MNKTVFAVALIAAAALVAGWIYTLSARLREPEPIETISSKWWGSPHSDVASESFVHWNQDDPPQVPTGCAQCHSGRGFLDYVGHDGSAAMVVDEPAQTESVVSCMVCHNEAADALETVHFPSGVRLQVKRNAVLCSTCHSGTRSGQDVESASAGFRDDEVVPDAGFIGPHYAFAGATWQGREAGGGYEYPGRRYAGRFDHAEDVRTCTQCHDPHSLRMRSDFGGGADLCATCHSEVTGRASYRDIVEQRVDYDGDGSVEGVYYEIQGLREVLHQAIHAYSSRELGQPAAWTDRFPYFFVDSDGDGTISPEEASFPNRYRTFTPRLLRAAFNYQFAAKDAGGYVHNADYVLQLLHDAVEDLSEVVDVAPAAVSRPR
jgi:hypothetical protein